MLRADVERLGKRGDLVEVKDGYARNFLLPRNLAERATGGMEQQAAGMRRARDERDASDRSAAEEVAKRLVPEVIAVTANAGPEGKLFGSVTTAEVAAAVLDQTGIEMDRHDLVSDEPIREVGTHHVRAKLHAEVEFQLTVEVSAA
jgi:large subunit ribosomal protein L9